MKTYTDSNGATISGDDKWVNSWIAIDKKQVKDEKSWVDKLRENGIKAAHPDDGWVDRKNNEVQFCYPQFNDGVKIGDLIALGWHFDDSFRVVKVIGTRKNRLFSDMIYYAFKEVDVWWNKKNKYEFWKKGL